MSVSLRTHARGVDISTHAHVLEITTANQDCGLCNDVIWSFKKKRVKISVPNEMVILLIKN